MVYIVVDSGESARNILNGVMTIKVVNVTNEENDEKIMNKNE